MYGKPCARECCQPNRMPLGPPLDPVTPVRHLPLRVPPPASAACSHHKRQNGYCSPLVDQLDSDSKSSYGLHLRLRRAWTQAPSYGSWLQPGAVGLSSCKSRGFLGLAQQLVKVSCFLAGLVELPHAAGHVPSGTAADKPEWFATASLFDWRQVSEGCRQMDWLLARVPAQLGRTSLPIRRPKGRCLLPQIPMTGQHLIAKVTQCSCPRLHQWPL